MCVCVRTCGAGESLKKREGINLRVDNSFDFIITKSDNPFNDLRFAVKFIEFVNVTMTIDKVVNTTTKNLIMTFSKRSCVSLWGTR